MTCLVGYFYPISISLLRGKKCNFNPHCFYSPETFFIVIIDLLYWLMVNVTNFELQMFSYGIELRTLRLYLTNPRTYDLPLDHRGLLVLEQFIQYIAQLICPIYTPLRCLLCKIAYHLMSFLSLTCIAKMWLKYIHQENKSK